MEKVGEKSEIWGDNLPRTEQNLPFMERLRLAVYDNHTTFLWSILSVGIKILRATDLLQKQGDGAVTTTII